MIYKEYDQAALDRQYNNRLQVPEWAMHLDRWEQWSRETEKQFSHTNDIVYGELERERLDIYPSRRPQSKTLVFIHGGYWQKLDKSMFHYIAGAFQEDNITTVLVTYPLAPSVSLDQIAGSCRKAMHWVYQHISSYQGDPSKIYVAGHSAGGHLVAMMLATNWPALYKDMPHDVLKGACAMSGLFNLTPIRLSDINEALKLDEHMATENSPVKLQPFSSCPTIIAVGGDESQEFRDQSEELYQGWKEKIPLTWMALPGINHYTIVEEAANKTSPLHQAICGLLGIRVNEK